MSNTKNLEDVSKREYLIFEVLYLGSFAILFGLLMYFMYIEMPGYIILELLVSPFVVAGIFNLVLKEKTVFRNTRKNPKIFFDVFGDKKMVLRYQNVLHYRKSSLRIFLISVLIFGVLLSITEYQNSNSENPIENQNNNRMFFIGAMLLPGSVPYGFHIIKNGFTHNYRFEYYFSKACFSILVNDKKFVDSFQLHLTIDGLKSYNKYLNSQIGRHVKKLDSIIVSIIGDTKESMNETIIEIEKKLQSKDVLELLRYLISKTGKNNMDFTDTKDIDKLKEMLPIILPPLGIMFTIYQLAIK